MKIGHVLLFLTYRCNLRCGFCLSFNQYWSADPAIPLPATVQPMEFLKPQRDFREMSTADIVNRVIPQCEENQVDVVALSGGEVLVRRDAAEVFRALGSSSMRWCFDSNLMLCDEAIASVIVAADCDNVFVSVDGVGETHNRLRCNPLAFERVCRGLTFLNEARHSASECVTDITINCVLQPGNESAPPEMVDFAREHGADELTFQLLSEKNYESPFDAETAARCLNLARERADQAGLRTAVYPLTNPNEERLRAWFSMPLTDRFYRGCAYIHNNIRIDPAGNVIPCLEHKVGNILETDLAEIWRGQAYEIFRHQHERSGPFAACLRCCNMKVCEELSAV